MKSWEFHPIFVHFPIAFLLAGVVLEFVALRRPKQNLTPVAAGLLVAGTISGWLAVLSGLAAFFTVPAHTDEAHGLMYWHLGLGVACLLLFTKISIRRWNHRKVRPNRADGIVSIMAAALLVVTGDLGGGLVYHGGAGVAPELLAPEIRGGHSHASGSAEPAADHGSQTDNGHAHD